MCDSKKFPMQEDFIEVTVHYGKPTAQYLLSTLLHIHHAVREAHNLCIANWSCHTTNRHENVDLTLLPLTYNAVPVP